jgi:branched-chain amino acid transport system permease protein
MKPPSYVRAALKLSLQRHLPAAVQNRLASLRDRDRAIYVILLAGALAFPGFAQFVTGGAGGALIGQASDAGIYVLLAVGLNVVVGYAGLLDIGYAAFFAIGAYTYGLLASEQLRYSPLQHAVHLPFWLVLFIAMAVAAVSGLLVGFPTLRLRGDYLAIVTLGFGEIIPRVFRNLAQWTGGVNGVTSIDQPALPLWVNGPWAGLNFGLVRDYSFSFDPVAYYWLTLVIIVISVVLVGYLHASRWGRAWMAVREDELAARAMGVNTVAIKLLAFAIGASFSGFAGCLFAAKLSIVSPENFSLVVSVTVLAMVVLGGMGNIAGVIVGALTIYFILFKLLSDLPNWAVEISTNLGAGSLNQVGALGPFWPGLHDEVGRLNFFLYGLTLALMMLFRPAGLLPNRIRRLEVQQAMREPAITR